MGETTIKMAKHGLLELVKLCRAGDKVLPDGPR